MNVNDGPGLWDWCEMCGSYARTCQRVLYAHRPSLQDPAVGGSIEYLVGLAKIDANGGELDLIEKCEEYLRAMATKKASGENIEEWQRNTVRVRVPKEPAERLAKRWKLPVAEAVVRAVEEAATDE